MKGTEARKLAVEVLLKVELESAFANLALASAFKRKQLSERDRAFCTYLVQGVIRHSGELDHILTQLTDRPLEKMAMPLRMVLRIGLFQLIYMQNLPASAVLNTSTQIARATGHEGSAKFATAVLRNYLKNPIANKEPAEERVEPTNWNSSDLSVRYTMPQWLVERWLERFGPEETRKLLEFSVSVPALTLRTCSMSLTVDALERILQEKDMKVARGQLVPECLTVIDRGRATGPIDKIPGYQDGLFSVQDEAASFVGKVLAPQKGWIVVDLCAAPGGKSIHIAELMENTGRVVAVDVHANRLNLLGKERRRMGLTNIDTTAADGRSFNPNCRVDAVLIDAPCTGTGVINRRSDLRRHREQPDIDTLRETQKQLLQNGASMLQPGGVLVYATCSMEREENQDNIQWFLENHKDFKADSIERFVPGELISRWQTEPWWLETQAELNSGMLQLLPSRQGFSGFFVSRLQRGH